MNKFEDLTIAYRLKGVSNDNLEYVVDSIKNGTKREFILENLTADYRGMPLNLANTMLDEFYKVHGGEFKNESRSGYLVGFLALTFGLLRTCFRISDRSWLEIKNDPWDIIIVAATTVIIAGYFFIKAYRGTFREKDSLLR